jgi:hypothetical protein
MAEVDAARIKHAVPWGESWWKPTPEDRVRELVKAGALIAAEIDRLAPPAVPEVAEQPKPETDGDCHACDGHGCRHCSAEQPVEPERCSGTLGDKPSWMSNSQYAAEGGPCRCELPAHHVGSHQCAHTRPAPLQEGER